jgi:hypothetical protein
VASMLGELNEQQIRQTAIILGLSADFIHKDYLTSVMDKKILKY